MLKNILKLFVILSIHSTVYAQWYVVNAEDVTQQRILNGEIEAVNKATVSAQTSGRVAKINYDVDDYVTKGSIIVEFTNTVQKSRLNQATAQMQAAKIAYEQAQKDYVRIKDVFAKKLVAKSQYDQALSNRNALKAQFEAAKAAVEAAQKQFDYTVISAPFDGIVTKRFVELGETINPGSPIMEGLSLSQLRVVTHIPEKIIMAVKNNPQAVVLFNDKEIKTDKITVFPYAEESTRTFKTRLEINSDNVRLFPGMTVKVAFKVGEKKALLIPKNAIINRSELTLVYVKKADAKILRAIKLGSQYEDKVEVISGLNNGEQVLLNPLASQTLETQK